MFDCLLVFIENRKWLWYVFAIYLNYINVWPITKYLGMKIYDKTEWCFDFLERCDKNDFQLSFLQLWALTNGFKSLEIKYTLGVMIVYGLL